MSLEQKIENLEQKFNDAFERIKSKEDLVAFCASMQQFYDAKELIRLVADKKDLETFKKRFDA